MSSIAGTRAGRSLGYQQFTVSSASIPLPSIPAGAAFAVIALGSGGAINWRDDGTAPTTTVGMPVPASGQLQYSAANLAALRMIAQSTDVVANVTFYDIP